MVKNLNKNIQMYLKQKNITMYRLSKLSGVNQRTLSDINTGKQKDIVLSKAKAIADALGVTIDDLVK